MNNLYLFIRLCRAAGTYILRLSTNCDNYIFMKQYVVDQLRPEDYEAVKAYLDENFESSSV